MFELSDEEIWVTTTLIDMVEDYKFIYDIYHPNFGNMAMIEKTFADMSIASSTAVITGKYKL